jgi:CHASE2 domain-containing sensor protein
VTGAREPAPGDVIDGKYRLLRRLGEGGMGVVYEALHLGLERRFALKLLRGLAQGSATGRARFYREAAALGRLRHPHIVEVTDSGLDPRGGVPYLVMELLEGATLDEHCRGKGGLPFAEAMPLLRALAAGVDHAHAQGVLHRDLKPQNVMLCAGEPGRAAKILDFGLAQLLQGDGEDVPRSHALPGGQPVEQTVALTHSGALVGTPCYAAPEVIVSGRGQSASDVYSLGIVAYELLVGRPPFHGTPEEVFEGHLQREVPDPAALGRPLPAPVVAALRAPLRKDPGARPTTATAAVEALAEAHRQIEEQAERARRTRRGGLATAAVTAAAVLLGALASRHPAVQALESRAVDWRFSLAARRAPDARIAVVMIDDAHLLADPRPLSGQADHFASVLAGLYQAGARAVALDLLLPEAWSKSESFSSLVLRHRDTLTLAAFSSARGTVVGAESLGPLTVSALGEAGTAALFGYANLEEDGDGVVRRAVASYATEDGAVLPSWGAHAARALAPPPGGTERFYIDYRIDEGAYPRLSWTDLPRALEVSPDVVRDRLVLVGAGYAGSGDEHLVPGVSVPRPLPGVLVHALIANTLAAGRPVSERPALGLAAAAAIALLAAGSAVRSRRVWPPLLVLLLACSGYAGLTLLWWREQGLLTAWLLPPACGIVAAAAAWPLRRWVLGGATAGRSR